MQQGHLRYKQLQKCLGIPSTWLSNRLFRIRYYGELPEGFSKEYFKGEYNATRTPKT